ncbi:MAG: PAS domain-containing protein, partial [Hylemonella sp.]
MCEIAIRQAYRALVRAKSEAVLLQDICQALISGDAYVHAWVSQLNGAGQVRTQTSATPIPDLAARLGQASVSSIELLCQIATTQVINRREPLILPGQGALQNDPFWVELNRLVPSCRLICVPILLDDLCLGTLSMLAVGGPASEGQEAGLCQDLALDLAQTLESLRTQGAAQIQQVQMRSLIEHSPDAILAMDHQGSISYANPAAESLLGLSAGQLMHTSLGMPSNTGEVIVLEIPPKPDDPPGEPRIVEMTLLKPQTEQAQTYAFMHEITQRKKAQLLQARLGRILERTSNMFLVFDADSLKLLDISDAGKRMLGYSNKQLRQFTLHDLKPDFSAEKFQSFLQPLKDAKVSELLFETFLYDAAGGNHPLEVRLQTAVEDE